MTQTHSSHLSQSCAAYKKNEETVSIFRVVKVPEYLQERRGHGQRSRGSVSCGHVVLGGDHSLSDSRRGQRFGCSQVIMDMMTGNSCIPYAASTMLRPYRAQRNGPLLNFNYCTREVC